MKGKVKNIIVIVLLVIFPISAIGLNVSVHKCKLKGTIHFDFFGTRNNTDNPICGCKAKEIKTLPIQKTHSCCNKTNIEVESDDCNETINTETEKTGIQILKSSCCTDSALEYSVNSAIISLNKIRLLIETPVIFNILFHKLSYEAGYFDKMSAKIFKYPLKKPISKIISFIYFTFETGDDSVPPHSSML